MDLISGAKIRLELKDWFLKTKSVFLNEDYLDLAGYNNEISLINKTPK